MGRRWGQHFLSDKSIIEKILRSSELNPQDSALEIGPGKGAMTVELCRRSKDVHAFEIDSKLAALLQSRAISNLVVHEGDFLSADLSDLASHPPWIVVANLPYYITAPILNLLFWHRPLRLKHAILMMQDEVAQRICNPASRHAGAISYIVGAFHRLDYLFKVPPGCFSPPPRVNSAVIKVQPLGLEEPSQQLISLYEHLVSSAFAMRRKQLASSLRACSGNAAAILEKAGICPTRRPETLSIEEFWRLARTWFENV